MQTYDVRQRNDIDWNRKRLGPPKDAIGLTNQEAADRFGYTPELSDGNYLTLHHFGQDRRGPLAEASTRYHGIGKYGQEILHSQYGKRQPHPQYPIDRKKFDVDTREYIKWRASNH